MKFTFWKYQGAGNDFILVDNRSAAWELSEDQIAALCRRSFSIGADGLMMLETDPAGTDFYMRYYNADGRESTMCGNGGRCIALFAEDLGIGGTVKRFNSSDGFHEAELLADGQIRLRMMDVTDIGTTSSGAYFAFTGSPHYVEFSTDLEAVNVPEWGRKIRYGAEFAHMGGTNVNFVQVLGPGRLAVRTFERGVEDETLACGTGVTAAALVAHQVFQPEVTVFTVEARGGILKVEFTPGEGDKTFTGIYLTGPAKRVFSGETEL